MIACQRKPAERGSQLCLAGVSFRCVRDRGAWCETLAEQGGQEIIEIYQDEAAIHIYRRQDDAKWLFDAVSGLDAVLSLRTVDLAIPLAEIYRSVALDHFHPDWNRRGL